MFDPAADPLADPALAALVADKLLRGADHPWEVAEPPAFDVIEAAGRFLKLTQEVNAIVGTECAVELWPAVRDATFHAELVLPADVLTGEESAVVRASNFANLIAVLNDDDAVRPDVMAKLRRRFERNCYRFVPSGPLRKPYDGHHRGTKQFARWRDRLFGYL
ncbi:MAG TPA: hypothetical protein VF796_30075 [Humisphaera sp.]